MVRPFYEDQTIPMIIASRLRKFFPEIEIILATSIVEDDNELVRNLSGYVDHVVRGSEEDVLSRFLKSENIIRSKAVVRICADNPFVDMTILKHLIDSWNSDFDYLANSIHGVPSMKTSFGFFAEITTFRALKLVKELTLDPFYFEHVTNYIYGHPEIFRVNFIEADEIIALNSDVRLTVDTEGDFMNASIIYERMMDSSLEINFKNVLKIANDSGLLASMKKENDLNGK